MRRFRQILFWSHLVAGLIAGLFIGVMCFTGAVLAFEDEIVGWSERDARHVRPPAADAGRLPLADLQRKLRAAQPEFRPASVILLNDPAAAVTFTAGRDSAFFVNPYAGDVRAPASTKVRDFMHLMTDWHRFLGREGDRRAAGKLVNGICNLAFCALALTGLYLWMPRTWSWAGVKAIAVFNWKLAGKARDFNWHNVIGLWSAPILIVLTLTAVPISFRWGGNLIYRLVGEEPPTQPGPAGPAIASSIEIQRPSPDTRPLTPDVIVANVQRDFPRWEQITLRTGGAQRGGQRPGGAAVQPAGGASAPREASTPGPEAGRERGSGEGRGGEARTPQPLTVVVREDNSWPRTATTTLTIHPFTGEVLKREGYAELSTGRKVRSWTRFLHTGQALGWPGQLAAGLACLGGCFLVYTGVALSWRRFFGRKRTTPAAG